MNVVVQVPVYDEPPGQLRETLRSITEQREPPATEVSHECWITPTGGEDPAYDVAESEGYDTYSAPQGKLSARNLAHDTAFSDGAGAVVTWDADAPALSDSALAQLVAPLGGEVVATNSAPLNWLTPTGRVSPTGLFMDVIGAAEDLVRPHLHGQASAITRSGWELAGPFDTGRNETEIHDVRSEEEFDFYRRLSQYGRVEQTAARVYNNPRRWLCNLPQFQNTGYCQRRGVKTFNPRDGE